MPWPTIARRPLDCVLKSKQRKGRRILRMHSADGVPIVPRGAGTSLWGSPAERRRQPDRQGRMKAILEIDYENRCVKSSAGVTQHPP